MTSILNELKALNLDDDLILLLLQWGLQEEFVTSKEANWLRIRRRSHSESVFEVRIDRSRIRELSVGPTFTKADRDRIMGAATEWSLETLGHTLTGRLMLSDYEPLGRFSFSDVVRLTPISDKISIGSGLGWYALTSSSLPENMRKNDSGPPYPVLLEVKTPKHSNGFLQQAVALRNLDRFQHLLSVLILGLRPFPSVPDRFWAAVRSSDSDEPQYQLLHTGLGARSDAEDIASLSAEDSAMPIVDDAVYYDALPSVLPKEMSVPSKIALRIEQYEKLNQVSRKNFDRSAYWFSSSLGRSPREGAIVLCLATAVECLLPRHTAQVCKSCGKDTSPGPTRKFREFLAAHAPVSGGVEGLRDELYSARSQLVHGEFASEIDLYPFSWFRDDAMPVLVPWVVRKAIANWLLAQR